MKIFISGLAGFLGSHIAENLKDHEITGCDNLLSGDISNVPHNAICYIRDCNALKSMNSLLKEVDVVVHCAASAQEGLSVFSPATIQNNTYLSTACLLSAAIKNNVKKFIFISSMSRYGNNPVPYTESMTPRPVDPYGIAKVASEMLIKNLCEIHGMKYTIIVPHNIIGVRQKYNDPYRNVASIFINSILLNKEIFIHGDGNQKRSFTFIEDCIDPIKKVIEEDFDQEIFNIGPDLNEITINELAKKIIELMNEEVKINHIPDRPAELKRAYCYSTNAIKKLDYKPRIIFKEGLMKMINWIKSKGPKPFDYYMPIEINKNIPEIWNKRLL